MTDELNKSIPEEEEDSIIELYDDDGTTAKFRYLATILHEEQEYLVLIELDADGNEPEGEDSEVTILQIAQDENGEDMYVSVEDDAVCEAVFEKFLAAIDAEDEE